MKNVDDDDDLLFNITNSGKFNSVYPLTLYLFIMSMTCSVEDGAEVMSFVKFVYGKLIALTNTDIQFIGERRSDDLRLKYINIFYKIYNINYIILGFCNI